MPGPEHRSFRLTQPAYMKGRRVKRRLLFVMYCRALVMILVVVLFIAAFCVMCPCDENSRAVGIHADEGRNDVLWMIGFGIALFVAEYAAQRMLKAFFIRIGLMTEEESRYFYCKRPPKEWTEEIDGRASPPANNIR